MQINNLKTKMSITEEFIDELITKGWQEIESLQNQIAILETTSEKDLKVIQLLKNLLTSYYVFVGNLEEVESVGLDRLTITETPPIRNEIKEPEVDEVQQVINEPQISNNAPDFEPFEYFVDFDEPTGKPLSDEDIYG